METPPHHLRWIPVQDIIDSKVSVLSLVTIDLKDRPNTMLVLLFFVCLKYALLFTIYY